MKNRLDEYGYRRIAEELQLDASDVKGAVHSFFDSIFREAKHLPFDNIRKIYTKDKFSSLTRVHCIPFLGRIGPAYSRYLTWRGNEARETGQQPRSLYRSGMTQDEIENMAAAILSGESPSFKKKRNYKLYDRVWLVGNDGKKLARQVIPKQNGIQD